METIILYIIFSYIYMAGAVLTIYKDNKKVSLVLLAFIWIFSPLSMPFHLGIY